MSTITSTPATGAASRADFQTRSPTSARGQRIAASARSPITARCRPYYTLTDAGRSALEELTARLPSSAPPSTLPLESQRERHPRPPLRAGLPYSVEERATALPHARRQELLADLRDHIEVALADADTSDENSMRRGLDQLSAPGEIAAAALEPGNTPVPESSRQTSATLYLTVVPLPAALIPVIGPFLAVTATAAALVRLWKSPQWVRQQKRQATLLVLSPFATIPALAGIFSVALGGLTPIMLMTALLAALPLPVAAAMRLGRSATRLRQQLR